MMDLTMKEIYLGLLPREDMRDTSSAVPSPEGAFNHLAKLGRDTLLPSLVETRDGTKIGTPRWRMSQ